MVDWNQYAEYSDRDAPGGLVDWNQYAESESPMNQTSTLPLPTQPPPVQSGPASFNLGASVNDWFQELPLVQEVKQQTPGQVASNAFRGVGYGAAQIADLGNALGSWMPRAAETAFTGGETPVSDALFGKLGGLSQRYRVANEELFPEHRPETFKAGGFLAQLAIPGTLGIKAATLPKAIGLGAIENAFVGSFGNAGEQLAESGKIDPGSLALAALLSGTFGGAAGAGGHALRQLTRKNIPPGIDPDATHMGTRAQLTAGPVAERYQRTAPPVEARGLPAARPGVQYKEPAKPQLDPALMGAPGKLPQGPTGPPTSAVVRRPQISDDVLAGLMAPRQSPPLPNVQPQPEGLYRQRRTAFGRNKADEGADVSQFPPEIQKAVQDVAEAKAALDYREAILQKYAKELWKRGEAAGLAVGGAIRKAGVNLKQETKKRLDVHAESELAKLREQLAGGVKSKTDKQHVAAILGGGYGVDNRYGARVPDLQVPDDLEKGFANLGRLRQATDRAEKKYVAAKKAGEPLFKAAQEDIRKSEPQASFTARTKVRAPLKEELDAQVSLDYNQMRLKLDKDAEAVYKKAQDEAFQKQSMDRNFVPKTKFVVQVGKKAMAFAVAAAAGAPAARAEDGEDRDGFDWGAAARAAATLAALRYGAPKLARKLINPETNKWSMFFNDTVQRIGVLDKEMGTDLAAQIWMHLGRVHEKSFGIKLDADIRAQAMEALRRGDDATFDALGLNEAQQTALLTYDRVRQNLAELVSDQIQAAQEFILENEGKANILNGSLSALKAMHRSLVGYERDDVEQIASKYLRNFMDYHFFFNPGFHLTNLSDMVIAGAARVGPGNLLKANVALAKNDKLKDLFQHSNLTGGFEAEKVQVGIQAGSSKGTLKVVDFKSDRVNADRVALAAMFQYRQLKGAVNQLPMDDERFAVDLLEGRVDPSVAMDAWAHVAEVTSRTLGVDPMRVNLDIMSSSKLGPYLAAFIRQPARISNLMLHYLADGDMKKVYVMLGAMAVAGGSSAMPVEVQEAWKRADPNAYFMAAAALDNAEVVSHVTGKTYGPKTQWSIVAGIMASSDPLRSASGQGLVAAVDALQKIAQGESTGTRVWTALESALSIFKPRAFGLPTKQLKNAGKIGAESVAGEKKIHYYGKLGRYGQSEDVALEELGINPVKNFFDQFLPGEQVPVRRRQRAKEEEYFRRHNLINWLAPQDRGPTSYDANRAYDPINFILRGGN